MVGNSVRSDILPVLGLGGHAVHIPYPLLWEHEHVDHDEDLDELRLDQGAAGLARRRVLTGTSERMIASMDRDHYLASYRRDSAAALLDAITAPGPDAVVPDCPGWTAADLAGTWCVGRVASWWGPVDDRR